MKMLCDLILPDGTTFTITEADNKTVHGPRPVAILAQGDSRRVLQFLEAAADILKRTPPCQNF